MTFLLKLVVEIMMITSMFSCQSEAGSRSGTTYSTEKILFS